MSPFTAEFFGTTVLLLLGDGVVANVVLSKTKGHGAGWIVITAGWALAVFTGVALVGDISGAHLNPAVTIGLAAAGKFAWAKAPAYIFAQTLGATFGAVLVWLMHRSHFVATTDADAKLGVFCTGPAIRNSGENLMSEVFGTCVLVLAALMMASPEDGLGAVKALPIAMIVFAVGLSLEERRATRSILLATLVPDWPIFCCRSLTNVTAIGAIRGFRSLAPCSGLLPRP